MATVPATWRRRLLLWLLAGGIVSFIAGLFIGGVLSLAGPPPCQAMAGAGASTCAAGLLPVTPEANGWPLFREALRWVKLDDEDASYLAALAPSLKDRRYRSPRDVVWDQSAVEALLSRNEVSLHYLTDALRRSAWRMGEAERRSNDLLNAAMRWTELARLLHLRALHAYTAGDPDAALRDERLTLTMGQRIASMGAGVLGMGAGLSIQGIVWWGLIDLTPGIVMAPKVLAAHAREIEGIIIATDDCRRLYESMADGAAAELEDLYLRAGDIETPGTSPWLQWAGAELADFDWVRRGASREMNDVYKELAYRCGLPWQELTRRGYRPGASLLSLPVAGMQPCQLQHSLLKFHTDYLYRILVNRTQGRLTILLLADRAFGLATSSQGVASLDDLLPDYLPHAPLDPFDNRPLRYSRTNRVAYSVGPSLHDDGGNPHACCRFNPYWQGVSLILDPGPDTR